jgi:hypothetical protein
MNGTAAFTADVAVCAARPSSVAKPRPWWALASRVAEDQEERVEVGGRIGAAQVQPLGQHMPMRARHVFQPVQAGRVSACS